ncbi:sigma-70 family RNA polymerase sigma factor, partial [Aeromicrobium sp. Leaf272]
MTTTLPAPTASAVQDPDVATGERLRRAAEAPADRRRELQNDVVSDYIPMAGRLARRYRGRGIADDDLDQVARLGLVKAIRRFDPERRSFAAYAVPTVLGEL